MSPNITTSERATQLSIKPLSVAGEYLTFTLGTEDILLMNSNEENELIYRIG